MQASFWSGGKDVLARRRKLEERCSGGHALQWKLLLDGTFQLSINIVKEFPPPRIGGFVRTIGQLVLPTGELALRSGDEQSALRIASVTSGSYEVCVDWSPEREALHSEIEAVDDYPLGEGPDGVVSLKKMG